MDESNIIIQEWGLDASSLHTKEDILAALAQRISALLMQDVVGFIQLMYRLDIPEDRLESALEAADASSLIAQLVWDRQIQKSILRRNAQPRAASEDDDDLNW
jgi:non-ribosomal peptide synthetase component F